MEPISINVAHDSVYCQLTVKSKDDNRISLEDPLNKMKMQVPTANFPFLAVGQVAIVTVVITRILIGEPAPDKLVVPEKKFII